MTLNCLKLSRIFITISYSISKCCNSQTVCTQYCYTVCVMAIKCLRFVWFIFYLWQCLECCDIFSIFCVWQHRFYWVIGRKCSITWIICNIIQKQQSKIINNWFNSQPQPNSETMDGNAWNAHRTWRKPLLFNHKPLL